MIPVPFYRSSLGLALVAWCAMTFPFSSARAAREVPNFNLLDLSGRNHELYRIDGRAVVLFFTGNGCPIARKSIANLRKLSRRYGTQGVTFWVINTYAGDSTADIRAEAWEFGIQGLPVLRDPRQGVAMALGVERTAEVVALDSRTHRVFYQGAIDDQFGEGAERPEARERYLRIALDEFLAGSPVTKPRTPARGCRISFSSAAESEALPVYATQVAPLLRKYCVDCHRDGAIGPWSMDGHERVKNHARMIEEVLLTRRMPPWDPDPDHGRFIGGAVPTRDEVQTLLRWVHAGAPRGEGSDLLQEPLRPLPDWPLGKPDVVLRLPGVQEIPATGVLPYRYVELPLPGTNDLWITGLDIKPGNRKIVHHVILYAKWPGCEDDGSGNGVHVAGWAPGTPPTYFPPGVARWLPANAKLTAELHYTTCGSPQTDQSEIAFYFAPGPQPRRAEVRRAAEYELNIPPGTDEARYSATYGFTKPATLFGLAPHMHVRGKWMRYELLLPDGRKETLLNVSRYDFNWQFGYGLAEPRRVPAGAWLLVTGAFDNSPGNAANPDPAKRVGFGLQSWDEMFIGFFEAADEPGAEAGGAGGAGAGAGAGF